MQPRLRSLYFYTMCKLIAKPVARTVGASSEPPSHGCGSLSGIGRLAAQPPLRESRAESVSTPRFGRLRIAGVCWRNPKRGLEEREPFAGWFHFCGAACNRSLSNLADLSLKSAPARASAAFGLFSRLAPRVRWLASASPGLGAPERQLPG